MTLLSSINFMPNWYKKDGKYSADQIAKQIATLFIQGIKK
jgi:TetR/AcrR family transcriptional regulator, cholesterol catabolism regulator